MWQNDSVDLTGTAPAAAPALSLPPAREHLRPGPPPAFEGQSFAILDLTARVVSGPRSDRSGRSARNAASALGAQRHITVSSLVGACSASGADSLRGT